MKLIAWFDEVGKDDVSLVGGKGANLGELTRAGLPVPPGFIVTTGAYSRSHDNAGLRPQIETLLRDLDPADNQALAATATRMKRLIEEAAVPADVTAAIESGGAQLGPGPVAVRSSATAEDLAEASFAGQQSTFLNVRADGVLDAVRGCWASLFEPHAIDYRARRGFDQLEAGMAVVVQRMVQSDRSGVMFTVHPVTGDNEKMIIEAVYGLGEAAVAGVVTPDCYIVDKSTLTVDEKEVSQQGRELVRNPGGGLGSDYNVWLSIPPDRGRGQKLTDDEITALAELGRRVEEHYRCPQDIEWAEESGALFVVQTRPVTAGI